MEHFVFTDFNHLIDQFWSDFTCIIVLTGGIVAIVKFSSFSIVQCYVTVSAMLDSSVRTSEITSLTEYYMCWSLDNGHVHLSRLT